jgi:hypothetical protein
MDWPSIWQLKAAVSRLLRFRYRRPLAPSATTSVTSPVHVAVAADQVPPAHFYDAASAVQRCSVASVGAPSEVQIYPQQWTYPYQYYDPYTMYSIPQSAPVPTSAPTRKAKLISHPVIGVSARYS